MYIHILQYTMVFESNMFFSKIHKVYVNMKQLLTLFSSKFSSLIAELISGMMLFKPNEIA